jgi:hypothetical protein
MALANIACLLAKQQRGPVLMIDWDLEAPGLHRFFSHLVVEDEAALDAHPGLIDLFSLFDARTRTGKGQQSEEEARELVRAIDLDAYLMPCSPPSLFLLKAGRFDEDYATTVNAFRWEELYERSPWLIQELTELLIERFRYVLIDSRTGFTDSSGICTMLLPEKLVVVFTPTRQSLTGILDLVARATKYRSESEDLRPLVVFPLASRVDVSEEDLRKTWRYGSTTGILGYQPQFEATFRAVYDLPGCDLEQYFTEVQIQHVAPYAYGEDIAVLIEPAGDRLSLSRSYQSFLGWLVEHQAPWDEPGVAATFGREMFINRQVELKQFRELLFGDSSWLLTIQDGVASGKTSLLRRFADLCRFEVPSTVAAMVSFQLLATPDQILVLQTLADGLIRQGVDLPSFSAMQKRAVALAEPEVLSAGRSKMLMSFPPEAAARWLEEALPAFVADVQLAAQERRIVILVDDYERAPQDLSAWFSNLFVPRLLAGGRSLGIVVAGQVIPPFPPIIGTVHVEISGLSSWRREDIRAFLSMNGLEVGDDDLAFFERRLQAGGGLAELNTLVELISRETAPSA